MIALLISSDVSSKIYSITYFPFFKYIFADSSHKNEFGSFKSGQYTSISSNFLLLINTLIDSPSKLKLGSFVIVFKHSINDICFPTLG